MAKYHFNTKGETGVCRARKSCPFGMPLDEHFATEAEARAAYEATQRDILTTINKNEELLDNKINELFSGIEGMTQEHTLLDYGKFVDPPIDLNKYKAFASFNEDELGRSVIEVTIPGRESCVCIEDKHNKLCANYRISQFVKQNGGANRFVGQSYDQYTAKFLIETKKPMTYPEIKEITQEDYKKAGENLLFKRKAAIESGEYPKWSVNSESFTYSDPIDTYKNFKSDLNKLSARLEDAEKNIGVFEGLKKKALDGNLTMKDIDSIPDSAFEEESVGRINKDLLRDHASKIEAGTWTDGEKAKFLSATRWLEDINRTAQRNYEWGVSRLEEMRHEIWGRGWNKENGELPKMPENFLK